MPLFISSLNSGSNGNCYYIGNDTEAILIDAGISCRKTEQRMNNLGLSIRKVKAIFISHEHTDHTKGAIVLSRKYKIPIYITKTTYCNSRLNLDPQVVKPFKTGKAIKIGNLCVIPFPKNHDASDPHSFSISADGLTVGVFTDIGTPCKHVIHHLSQCHAAFLESNYDETMLETGRYPVYLKRRISGDEGHLSNNQALELFTTHRPPWMQLLVLSHLSAENNNPKLVRDLFSKHSNATQIAVASRYEETEVFCIQDETGLLHLKKVHPKMKQLSLFD